MATDEEKAAQGKRASRIRKQIDSLLKEKRDPTASPEKQPPPKTPRDFVNQQAYEQTKKTES